MNSIGMATKSYRVSPQKRAQSGLRIPQISAGNQECFDSIFSAAYGIYLLSEVGA